MTRWGGTQGGSGGEAVCEVATDPNLEGPNISFQGKKVAGGILEATCSAPLNKRNRVRRSSHKLQLEGGVKKRMGL